MPASRGLDPAMPFSACLGTLLRRLRTLQGLTQGELGRRTGYDGSYIGASERAAVRPSRVLIERCDDILQAGGVLPALWALADREWGARAAPVPPVSGTGPGDRPSGDAMSRRPTDPGADEIPGLAAAASPGPGGDPVLEAMELARRAEASHLGDEAMAGLERAVARLQGAALATPPEELIPAVRAQRGYAGRLLGEPLTLPRHRRLLVAAGRLSLLLARLHFDAGDREAAEADRDTALRLACQADDGELAALAVELPASWALADGRFDDALALARTGQDLAPPAGMAAVQLALDEAQALASLGRRDEAAGAHHLAALTTAMLPGAAPSAVLPGGAGAPGIAPVD